MFTIILPSDVFAVWAFAENAAHMYGAHVSVKVDRNGSSVSFDKEVAARMFRKMVDAQG